jgi:hypothetical protein
VCCVCPPPRVPDTETWRVVVPVGTVPSKRSCPAWTKHEDSVFVFGGYDGLQRMNDFFEFRLGKCVRRTLQTDLASS